MLPHLTVSPWDDTQSGDDQPMNETQNRAGSNTAAPARPRDGVLPHLKEWDDLPMDETQMDETQSEDE